MVELEAIKWQVCPMRGGSLQKGFQMSLYTWIRDLLKYFLYSTPHLLGSEAVLSGLSKNRNLLKVASHFTELAHSYNEQ